MSESKVNNPIPKNTKTINDVLSGIDGGPQKAKKTLEMKRVSSKHRMSEDENSEKNQYENSYGDNTNKGYSSSSNGKDTKFGNITKKRTTTSVRRNPQNQTGNVSLKPNNLPLPTNDFDVETVNDGMNEIDYMLGELEADIPEDIYESVEIDVEAMIKANHLLRDKIKDISEMVITAIKKASLLKKQIITHRDPPPDPSIKEKLDEIKTYQIKVMNWKRKIKALNVRLDSLNDSGRVSNEQDKLKILEAEISELERQRKVLVKSIKHQQDTMNKLYDDPEYRDKVEKAQEEIRKFKDEFTQLDEERKKLKTDQHIVINEMAQMNSAKIKLREKRIWIENGIISLGKPPKAVEQNNEIEIMMKKSKVIEELNEKNKSRIIGKITDKEKRMAQVEAEISSLYDELKK